MSPSLFLRSGFSLFIEAWRGWNQDRAPQMGAALAYYTTFSIAPLLVLAISIAGLVFKDNIAREHLLDQMQTLSGPTGAQAVEMLLNSSREPHTGAMSAIVSICVLLVGASGVFSQLQVALNTIWRCHTQREKGWIRFVRNRFLSFTMVLGTGFLLMVSLIVSAILAAVERWSAGLPGSTFLWHLGQTLFSFLLIAAMFGMIFRYLPHARVSRRDVTLAALITSALFTIGKSIIGWYLGNSAVASAYGAAGSLVVLLVWVYYSAQILLFGAELSRVYAERYGSRKSDPPC